MLIRIFCSVDSSMRIRIWIQILHQKLSDPGTAFYSDPDESDFAALKSADRYSFLGIRIPIELLFSAGIRIQIQI